MLLIFLIISNIHIIHCYRNCSNAFYYSFCCHIFCHCSYYYYYYAYISHITYVFSLGNHIVTGSQSGRLFLWEGRNLVDSIKGHSSPILSCYVVTKKNEKEENGLVTVCSGGKVVIWNIKLEISAVFNCMSLGSVEPSIISVCWDFNTSKILLGFKSCEIYEIDAFSGRNIHNTAVVSACAKPNISGIATHPLNPKLICIVCDDKTVRIYDTMLHQQIRSVKLDTIGCCCSYSYDGQLILVGLGSGKDGEEERKEGTHNIHIYAYIYIHMFAKIDICMHTCICIYM